MELAPKHEHWVKLSFVVRVESRARTYHKRDTGLIMDRLQRQLTQEHMQWAFIPGTLIGECTLSSSSKEHLIELKRRWEVGVKAIHSRFAYRIEDVSTRRRTAEPST